jgi:hypothetical protein
MAFPSSKSQQPQPWFIATECRDSHDRASSEEFKRPANLEQLTELASLDSHLCPSVLPDKKPDRPPHIVDEDCMLNFFTDPPFLLAATPAIARKNILCVFRNTPASIPAPMDILKFEFIGYD